MSYDLLTDLEPVALISDGPQFIVAARSVPAKDIKELIAWLKANPGKAMVGTTGVGGASHLAGILFQNITGTNIQIVPYRGACAAHAGHAVGPDPSGVRPSGEFAATSATATSRSSPVRSLLRQSNRCVEGVMMLHGPIPNPGMERRRRVVRSLIVLVAIVVIGYVLAALAWLDLMPWSRG